MKITPGSTTSTYVNVCNFMSRHRINKFWGLPTGIVTLCGDAYLLLTLTSPVPYNRWYYDYPALMRYNAQPVRIDMRLVSSDTDANYENDS